MDHYVINCDGMLRQADGVKSDLCNPMLVARNKTTIEYDELHGFSCYRNHTNEHFAFKNCPLKLKTNKWIKGVVGDGIGHVSWAGKHSGSSGASRPADHDECDIFLPSGRQRRRSSLGPTSWKTQVKRVTMGTQKYADSIRLPDTDLVFRNIRNAKRFAIDIGKLCDITNCFN